MKVWVIHSTYGVESVWTSERKALKAARALAQERGAVNGDDEYRWEMEDGESIDLEEHTISTYEEQVQDQPINLED